MKEDGLPERDEVFRFSKTFRVEGNIVIGETHVLHCCSDMATTVFNIKEYSYSHTDDHMGIESYFRLRPGGADDLLVCPFCNAELPTWEKINGVASAKST